MTLNTPYKQQECEICNYSPTRKIYGGQLVSCPYKTLGIPSVGTGYCLSVIVKTKFSHG